MSVHIRQPKYSKEEFSQRGTELYNSSIKATVERDYLGQVVAIDIESGAFEVAENSLTAAKKLLKHHPNAQIFGVRIGYPAVHRFGVRSSL